MYNERVGVPVILTEQPHSPLILSLGGKLSVCCGVWYFGYWGISFPSLHCQMVTRGLF